MLTFGAPEHFLARITLRQLFQYFAAPLDAKIGLMVIESDNCQQPGCYLLAFLCAATPQLRTTALNTIY